MLQPDQQSQNSAESGQSQSTVESQLRWIDNHETYLQQLFQQQQVSSTIFERLSDRILAIDSKLATILPSTPPAPTVVTPQPKAAAREPEYRPAELFEGDLDSCGGFLLQCHLVFTCSTSLFPDNSSRITFVVNSLKGKALRWAHTFLQSHSLETTYQFFLQEFCSVFDHPLQQEAAAKCLLSLCQGKR